MAELLNQQAMTPMELPQQAGVKISPYAGLAKMLQSYNASKMQEKALQQQQELAQRQSTETTQDYSKLLEAMRPQPAMPERPQQLDPQEMQQMADQGSPMPPNMPAQAAKGFGLAPNFDMTQFKNPDIAKMAMAQQLTQLQSQAEQERKKNEPRVLSAGQGVYGPNGEVLMQAPFAPKERAGNLGVYDEYRKQQEALGKQPMPIDQFMIEQAKASRNVTVNPRERMQFDPIRGGVVNLDTGEFKAVTSPTGEPIGGREKPLTSGEVNKITDIDTSLGTQKRLKDTFDDKYAGYKLQIAGELANVIGSKFGGDNQAQAEWWASHAANDNIARNALFGASLTAGEQKAWEKTSINPGMSPSMIKNRMAEREALIEAKRNTTVENLGKAGYDVKGFKEKSDFYNPSVNTPPVSALKEGQTTTFANGQKWTLQGGKPVQVK
jgi:hypothetical protein